MYKWFGLPLLERFLVFCAVAITPVGNYLLRPDKHDHPQLLSRVGPPRMWDQQCRLRWAGIGRHRNRRWEVGQSFRWWYLNMMTFEHDSCKRSHFAPSIQPALSLSQWLWRKNQTSLPRRSRKMRIRRVTDGFWLMVVIQQALTRTVIICSFDMFQREKLLERRLMDSGL